MPLWDNHREPQTWTPASLRELSIGFQASRVLLTAIELRLFTLIGEDRLTSSEIAGRALSDPRATDRLLDALCAMNLLAKRDGQFKNTAEGLRYLAESSPDYAAGLGHTASMWHAWTTLTDAVRTGRAAGRGAINDRGEAWLEPFIAAMHYRARLQADAIAALLPLEDADRVLDVGGGSGAFAMAMVRRKHGLRAVVFDLPNVVPITERYIDEAGLTGIVSTATGDYLVDPLPAGVDMVFLSAVVHSNSSSQNAALVAKCAGVLNPGGCVAVVDWVMGPDRVQPKAGAFFALNMLVGTSEGDTFTEDEIRRWMEGSGLSHVERKATPFGTDVMIGKKV